MEYLDFDIAVEAGTSGTYEVSVVQSPAGEAHAEMTFPYDRLALQNKIQGLQIALLRSGGTRRAVASVEDKSVEELGGDLFTSLFKGEIGSRLDVSRSIAKGDGKGVRIKLRISAPELAGLPWEYLYDAARGDYLALGSSTPVIRYLPIAQSIQPLEVTPPLRILAMTAGPSDLGKLDVDRERQRLDVALEKVRQKGLVQVEWVPGETWEDLQQALWDGPWHIFHFVGHGGYSERLSSGVIYLTGEDGKAHELSAKDLAVLLGDHEPLRLALLNSCETAQGAQTDIFSSTAAALVRRGTPAVVAMQFEITDDAAIQFSRVFYTAIARGMPVDSAVAEARKSVALQVANTFEWGTPVLFMRSPDGLLFRIPHVDGVAAAALATFAAKAATLLGADTPAEAAAAAAADEKVEAGGETETAGAAADGASAGAGAAAVVGTAGVARASADAEAPTTIAVGTPPAQPTTPTTEGDTTAGAGGGGGASADGQETTHDDNADRMKKVSLAVLGGVIGVFVLAVLAFAFLGGKPSETPAPSTTPAISGGVIDSPSPTVSVSPSLPTQSPIVTATPTVAPPSATVIPYPNASITVDPDHVLAGETASVSGTDFPPNEVVTVRYALRPAGPSTIVESDGTFTLNFVVTTSIRPGDKTLVAEAPGARTTAPLTVDVPPTPTPTPTPLFVDPAVKAAVCDFEKIAYDPISWSQTIMDWVRPDPEYALQLYQQMVSSLVDPHDTLRAMSDYSPLARQSNRYGEFYDDFLTAYQTYFDTNDATNLDFVSQDVAEMQGATDRLTTYHASHQADLGSC